MKHEGWRLIVTAEHGGNRVPADCRSLFQGREELLASHRGWDPGTAGLARALARRLGATLFVAEVTRLVVDLNRSPSHPKVFSEITRPLPKRRRRALLAEHHEPHRARVAAHVTGLLEQGERVLHLGVHSFTPVLSGVARRADLALLYDPARRRERALADEWSGALRTLLPTATVRRNHPYRGASDGLTTSFRRRFAPACYLGIEIEVNQRHVRADGRFPKWVEDALVATLPPRSHRP